jgi:hypothetical protein
MGFDSQERFRGAVHRVCRQHFPPACGRREVSRIYDFRLNFSNWSVHLMFKNERFLVFQNFFRPRLRLFAGVLKVCES